MDRHRKDDTSPFPSVNYNLTSRQMALLSISVQIQASYARYKYRWSNKDCHFVARQAPSRWREKSKTIAETSRHAVSMKSTPCLFYTGRDLSRLLFQPIKPWVKWINGNCARSVSRDRCIDRQGDKERGRERRLEKINAGKAEIDGSFSMAISSINVDRFDWQEARRYADDSELARGAILITEARKKCDDSVGHMVNLNSKRPS